MVNRTLPDTALVMSFRIRGAVAGMQEGVGLSLPSSGMAGIRQVPRLLSYEKDTAMLLVIFRDGGPSAFFRQPLHELFNASTPLGDLIPRQRIYETEERLSEAKQHRQRIAIVEELLCSLLRPDNSTDLLVDEAIRQIRSANGDIRIQELMKTLPISRDPFEKRFRKTIGATPKQFAGIIRLRHLINTYTPGASLTSLAYAAGYFDQAHFIRDFKRFTGQSPLDFFKTGSFW